MANLTTQNLAIAKLYTALFNRAPDAAGFAFWVQAYENGASLAVIAQSMLSAPEALAIYPTGQTSAQFVTAYYTSVFGRAPDVEGLAFWSTALAAQGGADNPAARAALTMQISTIASTPLTTKPDGMSDAAYNQTVADRARFTNKTEFGVYFATELKSNDLTLAKSSFALVTDNRASLSIATNLALGIADPVSPPVIPPLAITVADSSPDIAAKFLAYAGNSATVEATGMSVAQLTAVAGGASKIVVAGITGTLLLTDGLTPAELTTLLGDKTGDATATVIVEGLTLSTAKLTAVYDNIAKLDILRNVTLVLDELADPITSALLGKATAGTVAVVATNASNVEVASLVANIDKISAGGITGTLVLSSNFTATQLTALLGTQTGDATATVNVDASTMDLARLQAIAAGIGKVDSLSNLPQLVLSDLTAGETDALLSKVTSSATTVLATTASNAELVSLATYIDKIAAGGITGTLALSNNLTAAQLTALLGSKTGDATATVNVDASAMDLAKLQAVAAGIGKVDSLSNLPQLVLGDLTDTETDALLAKVTAVGAVTVLATAASNAELVSLVTYIDKIAAGGITGTLALSSSLTAVQLTTLLGTKTGDATATVNVDASTMDLARLQAVAAGIGKVDNLSNLPQLVLSDLTDTETDALLSKAAFNSTAVVATNASNAELASLATYVDKIAVGGITGTLALSNNLTAAQLTALLGTKTGDATATVNVDASTMDLARLQAVAAGIGKVDSLTNLPQLVLSDLTDAETSALLSKVTAAGAVTVVATNSSTIELSSLVTYVDKIAADGITGDLSLSAALTDGQLTALLGAKTADAANVQINAAGMNTARLVTLNGTLGKVDGITGMALTFSDAAMTNAVASSLLAKAATGSTTANATGAGSDAVTTLITNNARLVDGGITGDLTLSNAMSAGQITTLLGAKTHVDANVQVNAASMDTSKLSAVAGGIAKADQILSLTMEMSNFTNDANEALLSKASGAVVNVTGALSSTAVSSLMNHLSNMTSVSGAWTMSAAQLGSNAALLNSKLGSAELKVAGDTANDTIDLAALSKAAILYVNGGAGADRIVFSGTLYNEQRVYINSRADTHVAPQTTDTGIGNFDSISGVNNSTYVRFSTASDVFGSGITLNLGSITVTSTASIGSAATIADVLTAANTLSPVASTSGGGGAKIYLVKVTGGSNDLAGNTFAILNDENPEITIADTIIVIGGTTIPNSMFEAGTLQI